MDTLPGFDLNALVRFAAVVEHGGFSPAARALGLPRQSIHRSVSQLEEAAGVRLLDRGEGRARPTDAGHRLFAHAGAILREARDAQASLRAAKGRPHGRLRLTAPHLFAEHFLAAPMADLLAAWPEVQIDADLTVARSDLVRDDLDLAIRLGDRPTQSGYVTSLGTISQICFASRTYLDRAPPITGPSDLDRHPVLRYGRRNAKSSWRFDRGGEVVDVPISPRLRVDSAAIVLSACRAGLGVALLPEFYCARDLAEGSLVRVCADWQIAPADVWAITVSRSESAPTVRAFLDLLRARLREGGARGKQGSRGSS